MQEKQGGENHELAPPTIVTESEVQPNPNLNQSRLDPSFNPDQSGLNPNPNPNGSTIVTISEICERSKDHVDVGILLDTDA